MRCACAAGVTNPDRSHGSSLFARPPSTPSGVPAVKCEPNALSINPARARAQIDSQTNPPDSSHPFADFAQRKYHPHEQSGALPMTAICTIDANLDDGDHQYRILKPDISVDWMKDLASEYVKLRTACRVPTRPISVDGIGVVSTDAIMKRLQAATTPIRRADNFDVVRSDFGEVLCYAVLEQLYGVKLGYKSVRDRELIDSPGRGIDAIGIEDGSVLTLVLGETKVSDDKKSPPGVVDAADDCLAKQHKAHIKENAHTARKLWNTARHIGDADLRDLHFAAALLVELGAFDKIRIVGCSLLVRPDDLCNTKDFGSFRKKPGDYAPSHIRLTPFLASGATAHAINFLLSTSPSRLLSAGSRHRPGRRNSRSAVFIAWRERIFCLTFDSSALACRRNSAPVLPRSVPSARRSLISERLNPSAWARFIKRTRCTATAG